MHRNLMCFVAIGIALLLPWHAHSLAAKPADSDLRMKMVVTRDRKEANIRFNIQTGESWLISRTKTDLIKEAGKVPEGSYDVVVVSGEATWWAFRIERKSGKVWNIGGGQWFEFIEPAVPEGDYEVQAMCHADTIWIRRFDRVSGRLYFGKWNGKAYEWIEMGKETDAPVPPARMPDTPSTRSIP